MRTDQSVTDATTCEPGDERCWSLIGVWGAASCRELEHVVHCHNCAHFEAAGRSLLERETDQAYRAEWTRILALSKAEEARATLSVVVFRLGEEWLAMPTRVLQEVTEPQVVRTLPHRSGAILKGLVNIRGELLLCVSLHSLLGLGRTAAPEQQMSAVVWPRLMVITAAGDRWAFAVDEVYGIQPINQAAIGEVPATVALSRVSFTSGLFEWQGIKVGLLEPDLVFSGLKRKVF